MGLDAGDVVLSITWHPSGVRSGTARLSHLDGRDDRRQLDRSGADALATECLGAGRVQRELPGNGVEWTRAPG
jgi:hypothetical protein